jgi:phage regulator Rha-like protein
MNTQIVPIERTGDGALIVSSLTIAEGAGVQHKNVLEMIAKNQRDLEEFGQVAFETRPGYNNSQVRIALLNEQQSTLVMTYQRNTDQVRAFKLALVKAFFEMAKKLQAPAAPAELSRLQILELAMAAEREVLELKQAREIDAPKVAYVEQFVARDDRISFRALAGNLDVPETEMRKLLIDKHWIYCETEQRWSNSKGKLEDRNRYSAYSEKKSYFQNVLHHDAPRFKGGDVMHTLKVTPAGAEAIARLVKKESTP